MIPFGAGRSARPPTDGRRASARVDLGGTWTDSRPRCCRSSSASGTRSRRRPRRSTCAVPPGVWTGFGIDVGPAWAHVSRDIIDRWGVDEATLLGTALENLRRRAIDEPPQVERATLVRHRRRP